MEQPVISFCFTTFKRQAYLKDTLESVRRQTYSRYEVIVSDNDPEQSGRSVVEGMNDSRFKYFPNEQNLGMKKSFNKSLERSSGDFIVMIADDDPVYFDMLETLVDLYHKYPDYGMYMGGADWFCTNPKVAGLYKLHVGTNSLLSDHFELNYIQEVPKEEFLEFFFSFKVFPAYLWSTCMVRREILVSLGGTPDYGTPFLGDYAYLSIMGSQQGAVIINKSLGRQTVHEQNFGRNQNDQIPQAAKGFTEYLTTRLSNTPYWENGKKHMIRFVGLWVTSHMAFIHHYYGKEAESKASLEAAEKEVFSIEFMKPFKTKYLLKKKFPFVHDRIVALKKMVKGK
jgi:glycosyltransferase involved in cell wall biosynthesis